MKRAFLTKAFLPIVVFTIFSCTANDEFQSFDGFEKSKDVSFDIAITRDGKISTRSDGGYGNIVTETDKDAKLDPSKPFGLMGVDPQTYEVLINNQRVFETAGIRSATFDSRNWHSTENIMLSAYYPYVDETEFMNGNRAYVIPYRAVTRAHQTQETLRAQLCHGRILSGLHRQQQGNVDSENRLPGDRSI